MPRFLKERKNALILAGLLFGQLVLLSLQVPLGDRPSLFEKVTFAVLTPLQRAVQAVLRGVGSLWDRYVGLGNVEEENSQLREEILSLRQENALLREGLGRLENREAAAAFLRSLGRAFLLASVVGVDVANPYKSITIALGSAQGLAPNMPVLDARGRLVGRIVQPLARNEATVQLITDDGSSVGVVTGTSRVQGILAGDGRNGRCWLKYVPATTETMSESEMLLTSGFDKIFPAGLPVGTILSIATDSSLFKRVAVVPFLDFRELTIVAVLTAGRGGE